MVPETPGRIAAAALAADIADRASTSQVCSLSPSSRNGSGGLYEACVMQQLLGDPGRPC
jgi:hypothetical protein